MTSQAQKAQAFKALHEKDEVFIVANPWDAGSARLLQGLGFEALATGAGGMREVYRARDTKLCREVAIKVLREEFSKDTARVTRFEREATLLASVNDPNIATLYGT